MSLYELIRRKAQPVSEANYPGLDARTYVLKKGTITKPGSPPLECDILVEQDVPVTLRDGVTIRTDVYRPVHDLPCPAIVGWGPYGKRCGILSIDVFGHPTRMDVPAEWEDGLNQFEAPNPGYWVAHGYAIVSPDPRGTFMSEGDFHAWGMQEASDEYDLIEWVASRAWSNGKVGLSGNSWLAMSQWFVAALQPPHLAAIAPWEGASDVYRDTACRGGIPELLFTGGIFGRLVGTGQVEDLAAMIVAHPLFDAYWASKIPDLQRIDVPAYVVASWTNLLHTAGTFRAWRAMASTDKWLRIHNTHEWTDYYDPRHVDDLRRFFDRYLKGQDNGWEATPRIRLTVLDPGHNDIVDRPEAEFPLGRQRFVPYYLNFIEDRATLTPHPAASEMQAAYACTDANGIAFRIAFDRDTEITGYIKLKLWVQASDHDDLDIFGFIRKIDRDGRVVEPKVVTERGHVGPNGRLRVSLRRLDPDRSTESEPYLSFDREEKLAPGQIVPIEIGFWPYSMKWHGGEALELVVTDTDLLVRPEFPQLPRISTLNKGKHVIHFGGRHDSHVLLPLIPC